MASRCSSPPITASACTAASTQPRTLRARACVSSRIAGRLHLRAARARQPLRSAKKTDRGHRARRARRRRSFREARSRARRARRPRGCTAFCRCPSGPPAQPHLPAHIHCGAWGAPLLQTNTTAPPASHAQPHKAVRTAALRGSRAQPSLEPQGSGAHEAAPFCSGMGAWEAPVRDPHRP